MLEPESAHADDRHPQLGDEEDDQDVGKKETWDGDEQIGDEGCGAVIKPSSENGRPDPDGKREGPGDDCSHNEKGQAV